MFENPLTFLRSMKGAPASVLLAFVFTRRPMTNQELQRWTGYSEESITQATHLLLDLGWVSAQGPRGPWTMTAERQLPLMASEDSGPGLPLMGTPNPEIPGSSLSSSSIVYSQDNQVKQEEKKQEILEKTNILVNTEIPAKTGIFEKTGDPGKPPIPEAPEISQAGELPLKPVPEDPSQPEDPAFLAALGALHDAGIVDPAARRLARLLHVTPEYVRAHVEQANAERRPLGTAVYRMEHGWPMPVEKRLPTVEDKIKHFFEHDPRERKHPRHDGASGP